MSVRIPFRIHTAAAHTAFSVAGLALVVGAAGLLSACSTGPSAGTGAANGGQSSSGGSQQASSGGGSVADGLGHPVNVCSLLPAATAASLSGEPITQTEEQDTPSYKLYTCEYTNSNPPNEFTISVLADDAAAGYDGEVQAAGGIATVKPITGLGDKAFSDFTELEALFGNVSISVSKLQSDSAAESLIRALQPKL